MMNGYHKEDALAFILPRIDRKGHKQLAFLIDSLISQAIDADMAFMEKTGVLDEHGDAGDAYYDDDEALEAIVDALIAANDLDAETAAYAAALVDDYMALQQEYLESIGLVDYE